MTDLTIIETGPKVPVAKLSCGEGLERERAAVSALHSRLAALAVDRDCLGSARAREELESIRGALTDARVAALATSIADALRPGRRNEIVRHLAGLVSSFPMAGASDGEVYGRFLVEDVTSLAPSVLVVEAACRKLRRTLKFRPAIAEVLEAISQEMEALRKDEERLTWLPKAIERAESKVLEIEDNRQRELKRRASVSGPGAFGEIARIIRMGWDLSGFRPELVDEVRREIEAAEAGTGDLRPIDSGQWQTQGSGMDAHDRASEPLD